MTEVEQKARQAPGCNQNPDDDMDVAVSMIVTVLVAILVAAFIGTTDVYLALGVGAGLFLSGLVGAACGQMRGKTAVGYSLGLLFGPIGWLIVWMGEDKRRHCGACREVVAPDATKCPHCAADIGKQRMAPPAGYNLPPTPVVKIPQQEWFLLINEEPSGHHSSGEVKRMHGGGKICNATMCCKNNDAEWRTVLDAGLI